ncbi:exopolygalacturonase-like [Benincasa hispida]|uniref:exopolygalacturonase-like n=1 Tax=Benincasa hispida TaxID=102211 RepID=UPI0018FF3046|nr:exopolygalacturonase-like [Benincasa hispida]
MKLSLLVFSFLLALSLSARNFSAAGSFDFLLPPSYSAESPAGDPWMGLRVFDVNDYGAIADGKTENSLAFMSAWEDACGYNGSSMVLIPEGNFFVDQVTFSGPCFNDISPKVLILGTLIAPTSLADDFWIRFQSLRRFILTGGESSAILDGQGAPTWSSGSACRHRMTCDAFATSLKLSNISNGIVNNIRLVDSKGFHVSIYGCDNIHLSGFNITAPWDSQNTDGIHISQSTNISITISDIGVGDDCVSLGPGCVNVSISDIRCGPGHGISVGSLGKYKNENDVMGIRVENCTINGTQNGVRVKTWPGDLVSNATNLTFQNIVMINVSNPIIIDQHYCPNHSCDPQESSSVKLSDINIRNISGTYNTEFAVNIQCSTTKPCENFQLSYINLTAIQPPQTHKIGHFNCKGALNSFTIFNSTF